MSAAKIVSDRTAPYTAFRTFKLLAKWTIFTVPLAQVINLHEGRLRGCALCISKDGTIAVIGIDGFQLCVSFPFT